jgi:hypothetical protein
MSEIGKGEIVVGTNRQRDAVESGTEAMGTEIIEVV